MEFEKLISITGQGSLFKVISRTNFGLIAESLEDQKRKPVYQSDNVSSLQDISIYTTDGEVSLKEVLIKIHEKEGGKEAAAAKEGNEQLKAYFSGIVPDFDTERVYVSDIKKVLKWYNQLIKNDLLDPEAMRKADEEAEAEMKKAEKEAKKAKKDAGEETAPKKDEKKKDDKKKDTKKTTKTAINKPAAKQTATKNAPTKKVQGVRKAGGS